jgi:putative ABC transport system permease protein
MFDLDKWNEIYQTVRKNKLRTFLTAFSVAWGIFMLIILLGAGRGLRNGFEHDFRDDAINSIWLTPGQTSKSFRGMKPGRNLVFENRDLEQIARNIDGVEYITGRFTKWNQSMSAGRRTGSFTMRSVDPDHQYLENTVMSEGRFLHQTDLDEYRKVAVIGKQVVLELFDGNDPIGQYIKIGDVQFKIVGWFTDEGSQNEESIVYVPVTTAQRVFNGQNKLDRIMFTTGNASLEEVNRMANEARNQLSNRLVFDPTDNHALYLNNNVENFGKIMSVFNAISIFTWVIGVMTVIAGVVGISNIMMIVVKERTREIGVRKALGATPWSIVSLIMQESIVITSVAGYIGLVAGIGCLQYLKNLTKDPGIFMNPDVDFNVAVIALIFLVVAGAISGLFPAIRAARVKPIEALRYE